MRRIDGAMSAHIAQCGLIVLETGVRNRVVRGAEWECEARWRALCYNHLSGSQREPSEQPAQCPPGH